MNKKSLKLFKLENFILKQPAKGAEQMDMKAQKTFFYDKFIIKEGLQNPTTTYNMSCRFPQHSDYSSNTSMPSIKRLTSTLPRTSPFDRAKSIS